MNPKDGPWLTKEFFENRYNYPMDELAKYCGQYIAWNWTGDTILDSDPDQEELWRKPSVGIDTNLIVNSYVPDE